jgi:hypothetical protein
MQLYRSMQLLINLEQVSTGIRQIEYSSVLCRENQSTHVLYDTVWYSGSTVRYSGSTVNVEQ